MADRIGEFVVLKGEPWEMYRALMGGKEFREHKGAMEAMEDLRICFGYLEAMDSLKFMSFDLSLARGLDHYTGVIYEAASIPSCCGTPTSPPSSASRTTPRSGSRSPAPSSGTSRSWSLPARRRRGRASAR